jgi:hypothetical protein
MEKRLTEFQHTVRRIVLTVIGKREDWSCFATYQELELVGLDAAIRSKVSPCTKCKTWTPLSAAEAGLCESCDNDALTAYAAHEVDQAMFDDRY